jgi:hypothetical protein
MTALDQRLYSQDERSRGLAATVGGQSLRSAWRPFSRAFLAAKSSWFLDITVPQRHKKLIL